MPKRIIASLHATLSDGTEATQGETVDLTAEDEKRFETQRALVPNDFDTFEAFSAFKQDAYRGGRGDLTAAGRVEEARSGGIVPLTDSPGDANAYAEWLKAESPTVDLTVAAAEDDPVKAKAILEAENLVTGQKPRSGVEAGLSKIIDAE